MSISVYHNRLDHNICFLRNFSFILFFVSPHQQGEEAENCDDLALALSRGLQLDTQRSSRDSLQCSSGYSTQTTTPCCSEDTIPSQGEEHNSPYSKTSQMKTVTHSLELASKVL